MNKNTINKYLKWKNYKSSSFDELFSRLFVQLFLEKTIEKDSLNSRFLDKLREIRKKDKASKFFTLKGSAN